MNLFSQVDAEAIVMRTWAGLLCFGVLGVIALLIIALVVVLAVKAGRTPAANSNLYPCPNCRRQVSRAAPTCPHCGTPLGPEQPAGEATWRAC